MTQMRATDMSLTMPCIFPIMPLSQQHQRRWEIFSRLHSTARQIQFWLNWPYKTRLGFCPFQLGGLPRRKSRAWKR